MESRVQDAKLEHDALKTKVDKLKRDQAGQRSNGADLGGLEAGVRRGGLHANYDQEYVNLKFDDWQPKM